MSTVAEIIEAVQKLPLAAKGELMDRLQEIDLKASSAKQKPYTVKTSPLGIRRDKLPSQLLAELDDEEDLCKLREAR